MDTTPTDNDNLSDSYLDGQLIVAMPQMGDSRFAGSVIYMCAHSEDGAMGIILNKPAHDITFTDLLEQLEIVPDNAEQIRIDDLDEMNIHTGGPVDTGRGFVLHSPDYYVNDTTFTIDGDICLTATLDILKSIATGTGPDHAILALGYAGWSPGQLENEIQANGWLHCPAPPGLVFSDDISGMYDSALAQIGVDQTHFIPDAGHA